MTAIQERSDQRRWCKSRCDSPGPTRYEEPLDEVSFSWLRGTRPPNGAGLQSTKDIDMFGTPASKWWVAPAANQPPATIHTVVSSASGRRDDRDGHSCAIRKRLAACRECRVSSLTIAAFSRPQSPAVPVAGRRRKPTRHNRLQTRVFRRFHQTADPR